MTRTAKAGWPRGPLAPCGRRARPFHRLRALFPFPPEVRGSLSRFTEEELGASQSWALTRSSGLTSQRGSSLLDGLGPAWCLQHVTQR